MSLAGGFDFIFVYERSHLCQKQPLPHCSVAAASHLRGNNEEKRTIHRRARYLLPASVSFFLGTPALFCNFPPPTMGTFLWQLVTVQQFLLVCVRHPGSLVTSHTPRSNQLPARSQINKSSLPSATLDAAALWQRWKQKDRHQRGFSAGGPLPFLSLFQL